MSNNDNPTRMVPDDRQEQIILVAATHFARHGYDKASMARIASEAGVTRALVYHYFPGKAALLEAVLRSESEALLAATRFNPSLSTQENLRAAIRAYLAHFSPAQDRAINLHLQAAAQPAMVSNVARANHAILAQRITAALALADDSLTQGAITAWLEFVTTLCAQVADDQTIAREAIVELCIRTLHAATSTGVDKQC